MACYTVVLLYLYIKANYILARFTCFGTFLFSAANMMVVLLCFHSSSFSADNTYHPPLERIFIYEVVNICYSRRSRPVPVCSCAKDPLKMLKWKFVPVNLSCSDSSAGVQYGCRFRGRILYDLNFKIQGYRSR